MRSPVGRDRLLHVVPRITLGTLAFSLAETPRLLPGFAHTLLHTTPVDIVDIYPLMMLQAAGFEVIQYDAITEAVIDGIDANAMIMYDVEGMPGLGRRKPSIYYSYRRYARDTGCACCAVCAGYRQPLVPGSAVLRPFVNTRGLMQTAGTPGPATVAMVYDDMDMPYPYAEVNAVLAGLPESVTVLAIKPPSPDALMPRKAVTLYPGMQSLAQTMLAHADIVVCMDREPRFGYHCMQAMALGKLVLCPALGFYAHELTHAQQAIIYDSPEAACRYIEWGLANPEPAAKIAANGKLYAGYADAGVEVGILKDTLRSISAWAKP